MAPYSYVNYPGDGVTANWTFPFPYLDQQNIYATVDGERWGLDFVAGNTVQLIPIPPHGSAIQIFRDTVTSATPNQWTDGSVLRDKDLNRLALFCLYCAQEQEDKGSLNGGGTDLGLSIVEILQGITGLITIDQFGQDLVAEIARIDSNSSAIGAETAARVQALLDEASARATAITSVTNSYQAADTALASRIDSLTATVAGLGSAGVETEMQARIDGDNALASQITTLASTVSNNTAAISTEQTARANGDTANANAITSLTAAVNANSSAITTEQTARANGDTANANAITTLQSTVTGQGTTLAAVQTQANTNATALGVVNANYTLKTEALSNGKMAVAGIGLNSTVTGTVVQSEIIFAADKFQFISTLGGTSETPQTLLQVGLVNGANTIIVAPTKIGDQVIAARMVVDGSLTAAKLSAGLITADSGLIANLAVQTFHIGNNAVTIPVAVRQGSSISITTNTGETTLVSATINSTGAPITIFGGAALLYGMTANQVRTTFTISLYRGATLLASQQVGFGPCSSTGTGFYEYPALVPYLDTPGAGSWTYSLRITNAVSFTQPLTCPPGAALVLLEVKK